MNIYHSYLFFIVFLLTLFVSSCTQKDFKSGETGYQYRIVKKGNGPAFKNNHYIFMNMDYYYEDDSMLYTSTEKNVPVTIQYIDTIWDRSGQIYHGLKKLKVGNSAIFRVNCSDLYEVSFHGNIPYGLSPFGEITVYVGIINMLDATEFRLWQASLYQTRQDMIHEKIEEQLFEDITLIDHYLEESGIIPMELESGIRYVIQDPGYGARPNRGDRVVVHYTGYLLDGTKFNSSYDIQESFEFILGAGNVIKGWDEAIIHMPEGANYTFYIPSTLAYGAKGLGELIGPNTVVVFDLELLEIKKTGK